MTCVVCETLLIKSIAARINTDFDCERQTENHGEQETIEIEHDVVGARQQAHFGESRPVAHIERHDEQNRRERRKRNVLRVGRGEHEYAEQHRAVYDARNRRAPAVFDVGCGSGNRAVAGMPRKKGAAMFAMPCAISS